MKTNVYIDGFNLYYRAVKDTPYKWLDLSQLCQRLIPKHEINRIRYFTANVLPQSNNPNISVRQQTFIRALKTIPNLTVHLGLFRPRTKRRPLVVPIVGLPKYVEVNDFEEKGSDVNLATYLLVDGYDGDYEQAVIISNDSDLTLPIEMVNTKLRLPVGVVNPSRDPNQSMPIQLRTVATFTRRIFESILKQCQFPDKLTDTTGTFRKPPSW